MDVARTPQGTVRATASKAAQRKRLKHVKIEQADGGFVVHHHYQPEYGGTPKRDTHVFANYEDMHAHLEAVGKGRNA